MRKLLSLLLLVVVIAHADARAAEMPMADLAAELQRHVTALATDIGERGVHKPAAYGRAADFIAEQFTAAGYPRPRRQTYLVGDVECSNIEVELKGSTAPEKILVIGAHYDTVKGTGGANDNSSGVAGLLALSRMLKDARPACTIRFVAFANEEPPYFQTKTMGSMVYAKACNDAGEQVIGMISLETIGFYSDEPGSQKYPDPYDKLYPNVGNFIAMVANVESGPFLKRVMASFKAATDLPAEGAAVPDMAPGVGWSDHWSFWQHGYPALMVTDTAPFRYEHYHLPTDTPDKLDYPRMQQVIKGLAKAISDVATNGLE